MDTQNKVKNSWICDSESSVFSTPIMDLVQRHCHSSEDYDRKFNFFIFRSRNWCNVIPVTEDGNVVLVKQFRIGIDKHTWEIPGGVIDHSDSSARDTAIRELQEETGYAPLPGAQCIELGWTYPNPAIMNNRCYSFVIGPVKRISDQKLDPGEMIEVSEIPISEIPELISTGKINHALILITFFMLSIKSKEGADALLSRLKLFTRTQTSS